MATLAVVGSQSPLPGVPLSPQGSPAPATLPNVTPGPIVGLSSPLPSVAASTILAPVTPAFLSVGVIYPNVSGSGGGQFSFTF